MLYDGIYRILFLDGIAHSIMNKQDPTQLLYYTSYFPIGFLFNPIVKHVLFVGGGFSGPKYFLATYPNVIVDVVEIDPDVIGVAHNYFNVTDNPRLNIFNDDARDFLSRTSNNQKYDIIILDAFSKNYVPFNLMTLQYYQLLYNKLASPSGVIVSNQIGSLEGKTSNLYRASYKTMSQVFPNIYAFPIDRFSPDKIQNIFIVATKNTNNRFTAAEIKQKELYMTAKVGSNSYINYGEHLYDSKIRTDDVPILTDQFAPIESLLNPITGTAYNLEQKEPATNIKTDPYSVEGTLLTIVLPLLIAAVWIFLMQSIWIRKRVV